MMHGFCIYITETAPKISPEPLSLNVDAAIC